MVKGFSVTFERFLPHADDVEICEADESGFEIENVSLGDAMRYGLEYSSPAQAGYCEPNSYPARGVRWLSFPTWNECTHDDICHGIKESRALHIPDSVTESSRARICRLFRAYGCKRESSR